MPRRMTNDEEQNPLRPSSFSWLFITTKNAKSCFDSGKDGALYRGCTMKAFGRRFDFLLHQLSLPWFCHRFGIAIAVATGILGTVSFSPLYAQEFKPFDQFLNISTRVLVGSGDNVAIAGFIVAGSEAKNVIIRAMGTSLTGAGISNALPDPMLELHDSSGAL